MYKKRKAQVMQDTKKIKCGYVIRILEAVAAFGTFSMLLLLLKSRFSPSALQLRPTFELPKQTRQFTSAYTNYTTSHHVCHTSLLTSGCSYWLLLLHTLCAHIHLVNSARR